MKMNRRVHIVILYVLVAVLVLWLAFSQYVDSQDNGESWTCSQAVCSQVVSVEDLVSRFCFSMPVEGGDPIEVCRVIVDGVEQIIPQAQLNLTAQCAEYSCEQEVRVRKAQYVLNSSTVLAP